MSAKQKVIKRLSKVYQLRDAAAGASTTLSAAVSAGATTCTVASATGISSGDLVRLGEGETMEVLQVSGAPVGSTVTFSTAAVLDHASGDPVVEQTAYDLGHITDGGATVEFAGETADVPVSTQRLVLTRLNGFVTASMGFAVPSFTPKLYAAALGIPLTAVTGSGTASSPTVMATDGNDFGNAQNLALVAVGILEDGTAVTAWFYGVTMDYTQTSLQLGTGRPTPLGMRGVASSGVLLTTALPGFTADTSLAADADSVWDQLTEAGYYADTATTDTLDAAVAAGATTIGLVDVTGFTAGDVVRIDDGSLVEFHQVDVVDAPNNELDLRSPLLHAHASGATVTLVTATPFAGVSEDGVTLATSGSTTPIRSATSRLTQGLRLGDARVSVSFGLFAITLANFARALGIPAADVSGGRLFVSTNMGTANIDGLYLSGTLKDGRFCRVTLWGVQMDLANIATVFNNAGPAPVIPHAGQPSSGIQITQWAA